MCFKCPLLESALAGVGAGSAVQMQKWGVKARVGNESGCGREKEREKGGDRPSRALAGSGRAAEGWRARLRACTEEDDGEAGRGDEA